MQQIDNCINYFNKIFLDQFKDYNFFIAGGCIRDYFMFGYTKSDIDVFFKNQEDYDKMDNYLTGKDIISDTKNAKMIKYGKYKIHLIKRFFNSAQEGIDNFDYTVCCAAIEKGQLITHESFFIDLASRRLVINKLLYPLSSMERMQKYFKKGFTICNGGILEIAKALKNIDFEKTNEDILTTTIDGTVSFGRID